MTKQERHSTASAEIDALLSNYEFDNIARVPEKNKYKPWYATALSALALLAAGQEVVYAESNFGEPLTDVRIVVFTSDLVLFAVVEPDADAIPVVQAVPRRSLLRLQLSTSERIDAIDNHAFLWPGTAVLQLTYANLHRPIELILGPRPSRMDRPEATVQFVDELKNDLAQAPDPTTALG